MSTELDEDEELIELFPGLKGSGYRRTSEKTPDYNCVAWAMGESHRWWEAVKMPGYHWPDGISNDGSVKAVVALFRREGFSKCEKNTLESGYQKVAIYGDEDGEFLHVARQESDGSWSSKVGRLADMSHPTLECLCGIEYGAVKVVMRRKANVRAQAAAS